MALTIQSVNAYALDVNKVRFGLHADKIRMVIELDQNTQYRAFMLPEIQNKPYRLAVEIPNFNWNANNISRPNNTTILNVTSDILNSKTRRVILELSSPAKILTAFLLPADKKDPIRLVVDFRTVTKNEFAQTQSKSFGDLPINNITLDTLFAKAIKDTSKDNERSSEIAIPERKPITTITPVKPTPAPVNTPLRKPLIVIDAGHGGQDPGAIGSENQKEKNVTLAAAKALKKKLESTGRYRVALTRDDDTYLKLYKRVSIARAQNADLFISLHADSIGKSDVRGASIYTLSDKASDAQTAKLASRENQADLIAGVDLSHEDKDVANILLDLAMRDTMNQSKFFANTIVKHMNQNGISILPRPHRFAGFAVLKAPDTPSVLIEMGFMSNIKEARLLSSNDYREKMAQALTEGINTYFQKVAANGQ